MPGIHTLRDKRIIFFSGKGGVGKTLVSQAFAQKRSLEGAKVLWVHFDSRASTLDLFQAPAPQTLSLSARAALEEYLALKIKWGPLAKLLLKNRWVGLLAEAAPGVSDLLMLGKIWHEREHCDQIVVDLPSTGHGITLFQAALNFSKLFREGSFSPLLKDTEAMLQTFGDPTQTGKIILALPEEMPLLEADELQQAWLDRFPKVHPLIWINRCLPDPKVAPSPQDAGLISTSLRDFVASRYSLEQLRMKQWSDPNDQPYERIAWQPRIDPSSVSKVFE